MAFDTSLAQRVRDLLGGRAGICERRMFGGLAFLVDGKMFIGIRNDSRMARVGAERHADQLGVKLFSRNKAGVTLTEAGAAFLPEAGRTLAQAEKAIAIARAARGAEGQFVVGYTTG